MNKFDKKSLIIVISSVLLIVIVSAVSFAFLGSFKKQLNNVDVNIIAENVNNTYFNVTNNVSFALDVDPSMMSEASNGTYVAENTATLDVSINPALNGLSVKCTYDIIFEYDSSSNIYGVSPTPVTSGADKELTLQISGPNGTSDYFEEKNFNLTSRSKTVVSRAEIINSISGMPTTHRWEFVNRFYNLNLDQSALANKSFKGRYYVANVSCDKSEDKTIYSLVKNRYKNNDEFVKLYNPTEFGDATIYANNIYYFNGAVENNNVLFAGFCWKIVRTTETGGIKMIYNGVQTNDSCNNTGNAAILTKKSAYSSDITSLAYVGYMYNKVYTVSFKNMSNESNIIFGSTFTYSNGTYKINNTKTIVTWSSEYNTLNDKHYTCLTTSTTCSSLNYIFTATNGQIYYMTLTNGESIDNALKNMLYADDVNNKNSTIKENIDSWYKDNMTGYTDKLEDTVFCNDRTIKQGAWEATSNISDSIITISLGNSPGLACLNETDRFSMSNNKAKLTYPVGLLSSAEASLALKDSDKNKYYLAGSTAWLMSPHSYIYIQPYILTSLLWSGYGVSILEARMSYGVRPVISLKPNTEYTLGDGSYTNPFVVE